jgi:hypothetical protein
LGIASLHLYEAKPGVARPSLPNTPCPAHRYRDQPSNMAATGHSALPLEVDDRNGEDDRDSAYAASITSSSESLASSIYRSRQENGRTYHAFKEGSKLLAAIHCVEWHLHSITVSIDSTRLQNTSYQTIRSVDFPPGVHSPPCAFGGFPALTYDLSTTSEREN